MFDNNPAGLVFDRPWKYLLLPGVIIQWWHYMNPGRSYGSAAASSRWARSQIMTYLFSAAFYFFATLFIINLIAVLSGGH